MLDRVLMAVSLLLAAFGVAGCVHRVSVDCVTDQSGKLVCDQQSTVGL